MLRDTQPIPEQKSANLALPLFDAHTSNRPDPSEGAVLFPKPLSGRRANLQPIPESNSGILISPQLAALPPNFRDHDESALGSADLFDLPTVAAPPGEVSAKWAELQSRIVADERTIAACRSGNSPCPPAARRFLSIVELGLKQQGRARLGWINRAVNLTIRPMSDWAQYGYLDYWASPLQTLNSGAGDCEDYAIVKYVALRELGIAPGDLQLIIVQDNMRQAEHAVVAVRNEKNWLILDNRTMTMLDVGQAHQYYPLFVMDYLGVRAFSTAAARQ